MSLAEKIITLRKKQGWSQEELAERLDVTRQSVSKWESAQSVPDISKIIQLSEIFGVSTDHLLKDEETEAQPSDNEAKTFETASEVHEEKEGEAGSEKKTHKFSLGAAMDYLSLYKENARKVALGVFLCIISPILLFILIGLASTGELTFIGEDACAMIGVVAILIIAALAVLIFVSFGVKTSEFEYMEKEFIELDADAKTAIRAEKDDFKPSYRKETMLGIFLCVIAAVPTILTSITENELFIMIGLSVTLLLAATGVFMIVSVGMVEGALDRLLEEGEYTREKKEESKKTGPVAAIYWCVVTAMFLAYSFITNNWDKSWIIWPVAGVLFGVVCAVIEILEKKNK